MLREITNFGKCNFTSRYLAIVTALCTEADYVFYPESPPPTDWPEKLCKKLSQVLNLEANSCTNVD